MTSSLFRPTSSSSPKPVIAIIGGGVTGAAVAYHLEKDKPGAAQIVIFEPRQAIGKGLAYDTSDPVHRINVPATRMSILPDDPDHFTRWVEATSVLADDPAATRPDGNVFPRRSVFGDYVFSNLKPLLDAGTICHVHSAVAQVDKREERWHLTSDNGDVLLADILVIATTHPAPVSPARLANALAGHPRFIEDPTASDALAPIRKDDRVLVVGNGLTSADVIASLKQRGHRGKITAISRRGLRSRGHAPFPQEPFGEFLSPPSTRASALVARIRAAIRAAADEGLTWHAVLDQLRAQGSAMWSHLPVAERRRIVRHLRPYWDVHRFRIAPQVEDVLDEDIVAGKLEILAASVDQAEIEGDVIHVLIKRRGQEQTEKREFDALIVTTGPAHGRLLSSQDWLHHLGEEGHLHIDPTGLGLACNEQAQALKADGTADRSLFIAGPLARGQFGELMGFPQVPEHAVFVAKLIAANLP
ncbi:FAD/NAD(P)-binding protein [Aliirhizobium smilacinae]|uniref:FAD-dependent oxidoreductase n=1 Tax=Aliirhizobium smilacinae TaxID=1395944 RepID=A0A5C4XE43_9HYPH|nr:FAD/NAD(P)-binding protein [Rhizobium smilacinae]TNM61688.1 FAD-dependent oxidoreductase [Rhizobium smilacinae]